MDPSGYSRGMLEAQGANQAFGASVSAFIGNPLLASIGIMRSAAGAAVRLADATLANAKSITRLADDTGASVEVIQTLRAQFRQSGVEAEQADALIRKYNQAVGELRAGTRSGKLIEDALSAAGIDPASVGEGDAGLRTIIDGIARLDSAQSRAAVASKIFGDAGASLLTIYRQSAGGIDEWIIKQRNLNQVIDGDSIRTLNALEDRYGEVKDAISGFTTQAAGNFLIGLAGDAGKTSEGIEDISAAVQQLLPLFRDAGEATRQWAGELGDVKQLLSEIKEGNYDRIIGSIAEGLWNRLVGQITNGTTSPIGIIRRSFDDTPNNMFGSWGGPL